MRDRTESGTMQDSEKRQGETWTARVSHNAARRARLFEMLRQRELAALALKRLHLKRQAQQTMPLPSPAALAASLADQSAVMLS